jgi:hypothetical protein
VLDSTADGSPDGSDQRPEGTRTLVYLNYNSQPLPITPLKIIDVAPLHDALPQAPAPTRVQRAVATFANVVRLVPGRTRIPVGPENASAPTAA